MQIRSSSYCFVQARENLMLDDYRLKGAKKSRVNRPCLFCVPREEPWFLISSPPVYFNLFFVALPPDLSFFSFFNQVVPEIGMSNGNKFFRPVPGRTGFQ